MLGRPWIGTPGGELVFEAVDAAEDGKLESVAMLLKIAHETTDYELRSLCKQAATRFLHPPMMVAWR